MISDFRRVQPVIIIGIIVAEGIDNKSAIIAQAREIIEKAFGIKSNPHFGNVFLYSAILCKIISFAFSLDSNSSTTTFLFSNAL